MTEGIVELSRPLVRYFRSQVTGVENIPSGPSLVVCNHSGGVLTPDMSVFAVEYYDKYGYDRPLYALAHNFLFKGPIAELFRQTGVIQPTRENAAKALASGAVVLVFPGGDYDAYRPSASENVIGFGGRMGYVTTAIEAGVPIVPTVSIGAQESELFSYPRHVARPFAWAHQARGTNWAAARSCRSRSAFRSGSASCRCRSTSRCPPRSSRRC